MAGLSPEWYTSSRFYNPRDNRAHHSPLSSPQRTSNTDPGGRKPFHITATSKNGSVTLHLPRSFQGFLTLTTTNGTIIFSDQLAPHVTTFSHVSSTKRCFIGDLTSWLDRDQEWKGDEVTASSHNGKVKLQFVDEVKATKGKGNFWSRALGL